MIQEQREPFTAYSYRVDCNIHENFMGREGGTDCGTPMSFGNTHVSEYTLTVRSTIVLQVMLCRVFDDEVSIPFWNSIIFRLFSVVHSSSFWRFLSNSSLCHFCATISNFFTNMPFHGGSTECHFYNCSFQIWHFRENSVEIVIPVLSQSPRSPSNFFPI